MEGIRLPPKGWRKKPDSTQFLEPTRFNKSFTAFGDRLNFLSDEKQHLATGRLRILPPLNPERRERGSA